MLKLAALSVVICHSLLRVFRLMTEEFIDINFILKMLLWNIVFHIAFIVITFRVYIIRIYNTLLNDFQFFTRINLHYVLLSNLYPEIFFKIFYLIQSYLIQSCVYFHLMNHCQYFLKSLPCHRRNFM